MSENSGKKKSLEELRKKLKKMNTPEEEIIDSEISVIEAEIEKVEEREEEEKEERGEKEKKTESDINE